MVKDLAEELHSRIRAVRADRKSGIKLESPRCEHLGDAEWS